MNGRMTGVRNWAVSLAATAASTYALDACAATAGISLLASGLLAGLTLPWVVAFLLASNAVWGLALRANVRANWKLLGATGISTSVLSEAAYDLTRRRTSNPRASRLAGHGYAAIVLGRAHRRAAC
jgi:hypothetical protein